MERTLYFVVVVRNSYFSLEILLGQGLGGVINSLIADQLFSTWEIIFGEKLGFFNLSACLGHLVQFTILGLVL